MSLSAGKAQDLILGEGKKGCVSSSRSYQYPRCISIFKK